ncbi:MAG: GDSL-type esterase/lipase family protein [Oscillospiraceae bacterium]|nr:GDSL-type esterase/lipase family protein [Oscillospiraceae bacterium]
MKKIFTLLICLMVLFSFTGCTGNEPSEPENVQDVENNKEKPAEQEEQPPEEEEEETGGIWVGTWASAQYYGDNSGDGGKKSALNISKNLPDSTLRQIIRTSSGGEQLRLTFSNEYGETPMTIQAVHIAKATVPAKSDIDVSTDTPVTFDNGSAGVTIPAGQKVFSDPVDFPVDALERIAVSVYFGEMPETVSCHVAARANSFIEEGNVISNESLNGSTNTHWFVLCNVDILSPAESKSIVALGDSITDGYGTKDEEYLRWVDILMNNLQANEATKHLSVINMGIGTNTLLNQQNPTAVIDRFKRDVLEQPEVGYLVFLIGVNDLGGSASAESMINAYDEIIKAAQENGIKVYGGTITPTGKQDDKREAVNDWLRLQYREGNMHGLADFDELLKNPDNPNTMLPEYDNDGLHPSIAGYAAMGEYVYALIAEDNGN